MLNGRIIQFMTVFVRLGSLGWGVVVVIPQVLAPFSQLPVDSINPNCEHP